jgi:hypothetical protein
MKRLISAISVSAVFVSSLNAWAGMTAEAPAAAIEFRLMPKSVTHVSGINCYP